jgi:hypothetical protein
MENNAELRSKLEKFMSARIPVHIVLKKKQENGKKHEPRFLNGYIIGKKTEDIFVMEERKIGNTYVLLDDIYDASVFVENNNILVDKFVKDNDIKLGEGVMREEIDIVKKYKEVQEAKKAREEAGDIKTSFK